jgi:uncharacterized protein YjiS (DUF1127 family)
MKAAVLYHQPDMVQSFSMAKWAFFDVFPASRRQSGGGAARDRVPSQPVALRHTGCATARIRMKLSLSSHLNHGGNQPELCNAQFAMVLCNECATANALSCLSSGHKTDTNLLETRTKMNLIRNYRNWRRYRETVNELSRLSNRELNDLGISRGDIPFVARKSL